MARAGLVAALKHDAIPGSARWPVAICRPGPDPLESLAVALSRALNVGQGAPALAELIAELSRRTKRRFTSLLGSRYPKMRRTCGW